jgi:hypothetical protein
MKWLAVGVAALVSSSCLLRREAALRQEIVNERFPFLDVAASVPRVDDALRRLKVSDIQPIESLSLRLIKVQNPAWPVQTSEAGRRNQNAVRPQVLDALVYILASGGDATEVLVVPGTDQDIADTF